MDEMQFERQDAIAILTVNRPEQRNAMTWEMYDQLVELCNVVDEDDDIQVWIMRGAGEKAFISGTDISQFTAFQDDPNAGLEYEIRLDGVVGRLASVRKPTIAFIDGFAVGAGLLLALNCDLRLATPESQLSIPCVKLSNCLSMASYAKLLELIGPARTLEMVYTGRLVNAAEAEAFGLVNTVVPRAEIDAYIMELAYKIAKAAPITIQASKEAVRRLTKSAVPNGDDLIRACYTSRDFREGVLAFLEKRSPQWRGQ